MAAIQNLKKDNYPSEFAMEKDEPNKVDAKEATDKKEIKKQVAEVKSDKKSPAGKRILMFSILALVVAGGTLGYNYYMQHIGNRYVKTDNAYAAVELSQVTPIIGGTVTSVNFDNTQSVKAGDILFTLDDTDQKLAAQEAEAQIEVASRKISGQMDSDRQFAAQIKARDADAKTAQAKLVAANADFEKAKTDLARRQSLSGTGAVSPDEITAAQHAYDAAAANVELAKASINQAQANRVAAIGSRISNASSFINSSVDTNPEVVLAKTKKAQALVDLDRTVIRAPISGVIANRQLEVGQRIQSGMTVMQIVPIDKIHIDANFKEGQLKNVTVGQKAEVTSDLYGEKVVYHGTVTGFSGGTGSAFSLIPAQNASGNWIKVVQRLPVRIEIPREELLAHPLKVGLSMSVKIDTKSENSNKETSGKK